MQVTKIFEYQNMEIWKYDKYNKMNTSCTSLHSSHINAGNCIFNRIFIFSRLHFKNKF